MREQKEVFAGRPIETAGKKVLTNSCRFFLFNAIYELSLHIFFSPPLSLS